MPDRPRVLCVSDVHGWAFDQNLRDLAFHLRDEFVFDHWYVADFYRSQFIPDWQWYDIVFVPYHKWRLEHLFPWDRTLGSLRAFWFNVEQPGPPGAAEFAMVNRHRGFHVVTQRNLDEIKVACPRAVYLTNPVNMDRFAGATPPRTEIIAAWNGNAQHFNPFLGDVKGFESIVKPACSVAGIPLVAAEYNTTRLAPQEMPAFYKQANVALCASLYEGASNSVMEAAAAGLALITTDCGNAREMHDSQIAEYGESGILIVERDVQAFADALRAMTPERAAWMGYLNRLEIDARWSWREWAARYADFLRMALPEAEKGSDDAAP